MTTMLEKMRARVAERRVANRDAHHWEAEWEHAVREMYLDPDVLTVTQRRLASAIYGIKELSGGDLDDSDYRPVFTAAIEDVQTVAEMMWKGCADKIGHNFVDNGPDADLHEHLFGQIETALRVRHREWTEEYKKERFEALVNHWALWGTVDENENALAWKPENITPETPPEWWVCDQLHRPLKSERRELVGYFQDQWTWEDDSHHNRYLWETADSFAKEEDSDSFIDKRMIGYYQRYESANRIS